MFGLLHLATKQQGPPRPPHSTHVPLLHPRTVLGKHELLGLQHGCPGLPHATQIFDAWSQLARSPQKFSPSGPGATRLACSPTAYLGAGLRRALKRPGERCRHDTADGTEQTAATMRRGKGTRKAIEGLGSHLLPFLSAGDRSRWVACRRGSKGRHDGAYGWSSCESDSSTSLAQSGSDGNMSNCDGGGHELDVGCERRR